MLLQEAGDAADGVGGALAQVDAVVAVEVDGIARWLLGMNCGMPMAPA
jgi:hypothetical protein